MESKKLRPSKWITAAIADWTIIVMAIALCSYSLWFLPLSILVIGNRQHALAILGHDGAHSLITRNRPLNDLLTNWLVFYPLGISLKEYRKFHWAHHQNTNTEYDPEVILKRIKPHAMVMPFSQRKVIGHVLSDLLGCGIPQLFAFLWHVKPKSAIDTLLILVAPSVAVVLVLCGFVVEVAAWYLSLFTSFWAFFRYRVWAEHVGGREYETLVFDTNLIQRLIFFPHNCDKHYEHHQNCSVPFYDLIRPVIGIGLCQARRDNLFIR
jgi:fatty acid desaturase